VSVHGEHLGQLACPNTFTSAFFELTIPALRNTSGVISLSLRLASFSRFTTSYSVRKMLVKPRLGQTAMQRHLAAFKSAHHARAAARALAFMTTGGSLAHARAHATANSLAFFARFARALNVLKFMFDTLNCALYQGTT